MNLEALRQHLIDMNEVTLKAEPREAVDGGIEIAVTGGRRTAPPSSAWSRLMPRKSTGCIWLERQNRGPCRTGSFSRSLRPTPRKFSISAGSASAAFWSAGHRTISRIIS